MTISHLKDKYPLISGQGRLSKYAVTKWNLVKTVLREAMNTKTTVKVESFQLGEEGGSEDRQFQLKTGELNFSNFQKGGRGTG